MDFGEGEKAKRTIELTYLRITLLIRAGTREEAMRYFLGLGREVGSGAGRGRMAHQLRRGRRRRRRPREEMAETERRGRRAPELPSSSSGRGWGGFERRLRPAASSCDGGFKRRRRL
jgi:hypothetical protein